MGGKMREITFTIDENDCYICTSHFIDRDGYPRVKSKGKQLVMSRYIYTLRFGEIPEGMVIRHSCDNPSCINIEHLKVGTHQDNSDDKYLRHREKSVSGEAHGMCKLTKLQVDKIRLDDRLQRVIADEYGISQTQISDIKNNKKWKK